MIVRIIVALSVLVLPLVIILSGRLLLANTPGKPNSFYGYRTKRASMTQESWAFAQTYSGKYLCSAGKITFLLSLIVAVVYVVLLNYIDIEQSTLIVQLLIYIPMAIQIIVLLSVVPYTERALKNRFNPQ